MEESDHNKAHVRTATPASSCETLHNAAEKNDASIKAEQATTRQQDGMDEEKQAMSDTSVPPAPTAAPDSAELPPPPDGGFLAWAQVAGALFLFFNCWGIVNSFGSFQTFYETDLLVTSSSSAISWVGSIQAFLLTMGAFLTGPLLDQGYLRLLLCLGTFLVVFGMMMTSLATAYYQVLLAQGFCAGLGFGCLFIPSVAIVPTYFARRKALALGIAASGSSLGGVLYPIIFHRLEPQLGFPWITRLLGFIILATLVLPLLVMRTRLPPPPKPRSLWHKQAWSDRCYFAYNAGSFLAFLGLYVPFFYTQLYAIEKQLMDEEEAFYMLAVMNAGSLFGRIIPNALADRLGPMNVLITCGFVTGILALCLPAVNSAAGLIAFAALYGFFSGSFVSLPPAVIVNVSPDLAGVGVRLGMFFAVIGVGLLIGNPVAGAILGGGGAGNNWVGLAVFSGVTVIVGTLMILEARVWRYGWRLRIAA